ncbi:MAG: ParB/RepB/Spo0J family partition protein [Planctomycetota bacterium]
MTTKTLPISKIECDPHLQSRVANDDDAVADYAAAIEAGEDLPPVDVMHDGETYWLADGFHRVMGSEQAGRTKIKAVVYQGTRSDAVWHAAGANTRHGVRRTNADKRRQVEMALAEKPEESDRAIAKHCGVSHTMVASARSELESGGKLCHLDERTGQDGKSYPSASESAGDAAEPEESGGKVCHLDDENTPGDVDSCGLDAVFDDDTEPDSDEDPTVDEDDPPGADDQEQTIAEELAATAQPYKRAVNDLLRIKRDMQAAADDQVLGAHLRQSINRIVADLDNAKSTIRQLEPVAICEACGGEGCERCSGTGHLTRMLVERSQQ